MLMMLDVKASAKTFLNYIATTGLDTKRFVPDLGVGTCSKGQVSTYDKEILRA
jgi:hypothetical protein